MFVIILFLNFVGTVESLGLEIYEQPGECVTCKNLKVIQAKDDGTALAVEKDLFSVDNLVMLLINDNGKSYYDGEKILIPRNMCARQVGIYKYVTNNNVNATIPAVRIMLR